MALRYYMPLGHGQDIASPILEGIAKQSVGASLLPVVSPYIPHQRRSERANRNSILQLALQSTADFFVMIDRDVYLLDPTVIERAVQILEEPNNNIISVHVEYKPGADSLHYDMGCVVMRQAVAVLEFRFMNYSQSCCCGEFKDWAMARGFRQVCLSTADKLSACEYHYSEESLP